MSQERPSLGFDQELDNLDPPSWAPRLTDRPSSAATRLASELSGFTSRQPPQLVRGRRTGRNMQLNLKARPDTIAAFCAVADANGWGLGETLEWAVTLLEREFGRK